MIDNITLKQLKYLISKLDCSHTKCGTCCYEEKCAEENSPIFPNDYDVILHLNSED